MARKLRRKLKLGLSGDFREFSTIRVLDDFPSFLIQ